eukprot:scaffold14530_cov217-Amphora_coffeaeformis.AAC.5
MMGIAVAPTQTNYKVVVVNEKYGNTSIPDPNTELKAATKNVVLPATAPSDGHSGTLSEIDVLPTLAQSNGNVEESSTTTNMDIAQGPVMWKWIPVPEQEQRSTPRCWTISVSPFVASSLACLLPILSLAVSRNPCNGVKESH